MKKLSLNSFLLIFSAIIISFYLFLSKKSEETIIFFPIDPSHYFENAATHLHASSSGKEIYFLQWKVDSTLNDSAYLRQDISILYKNGQLEGILNKWRQHTQMISQKEEIKDRENARFDAISFHYAEIHPMEDTYTSVQQMSKANLYAVTSPSFTAFQNPVSEVQKQWHDRLDNYTNTKIRSSLNKALVHFQINKDQYQTFSLTDLPTQVNQIFRMFPKQKQEEIIGKLWEGLYKNYFLGIKKENGTLVSPKGSSIPQLLVANNQREILVLFTLKDGTPILLRQKI